MIDNLVPLFITWCNALLLLTMLNICLTFHGLNNYSIYLNVNTKAVLTGPKLPIVDFDTAASWKPIVSVPYTQLQNFSVHSCINRRSMNQYMIVRYVSTQNNAISKFFCEFCKWLYERVIITLISGISL